MNLIDYQLYLLKIQIEVTRQKLSRTWDAHQMTDTVVLAVGKEMDELCNEYERMRKAYMSGL